MKNEAIKRMKAMEILPQVISRFESNGDVAIFENQGSIFKAVYYSLNTNLGQEDYNWLKAQIKAFEEENKAVVYMVQKSYTGFGELYSLFYIDEDKERYEEDYNELMDGYAFVYVINKDYNECSEFGTIAIAKAMGGIYRLS